MTHIIIIFQLTPLTARVKGVFLAGSHQNDRGSEKRPFIWPVKEKMTGTGITQSVLVKVMTASLTRTSISSLILLLLRSSGE